MSFKRSCFVKSENRSCCHEYQSKVAKEKLGAERRLSSHSPNRNLKGHYNIRKNIFACLFSIHIHNIKSLSRHERDIIILFSKNYLWRKNFWWWRSTHSNGKNCWQGQLLSKFFFQISYWKNKTSKHVPSLTKTKCWQRMEVSLSLCRLPIEFCIAAIPDPTSNRRTSRNSTVQLQKILSKCKSHQTISDMLWQIKTVFTPV